MKKTIITLAIVAALATLGAQAFAYGPGYGCWNNTPATAENAEQYQAFLDQTTDLRRGLAVDHAELAALMHADNPDPAAVRALTERILDQEEAINEQAEALGVDNGWTCPFGGNGRGYGHRGYNGNGGHMMW